MSELTDSFGEVDLVAYEYATAGLSLLEDYLDSQRLVLRDVNGNALFSLDGWLAAIERCEWSSVPLYRAWVLTRRQANGGGA